MRERLRQNLIGTRPDGPFTLQAKAWAVRGVVSDWDNAMSHGVKLTLFVLAFNVIGFAEGYLLRDLGLVWLLPMLVVTFVAVLATRRVF